jgi:hypothetical protein
LQAERANQHNLLQRRRKRGRRPTPYSVVGGSSLKRPIAERHRIIFYVGHLEAFDWNLLGQRALGLKSFAKEFDRLFAFGIDPVGGGLPTDVESDWPVLQAVQRYVDRVRTELDNAVSRVLSDGEIGSPEFPLTQLLEVAIEHRLMHAETLAYMLHRLPLQLKIWTKPDARCAGPVAKASWKSRRNGGAQSAAPRRGFGRDNEYEQHITGLPAFELTVQGDQRGSKCCSGRISGQKTVGRLQAGNGSESWHPASGLASGRRTLVAADDV